MSQTRSRPVHAPLRFYQSEQGELLIGGQKVSELARAQDHLPCYFYDRAVMSEQVSNWRQALPEGIHLHYAMKANPMPDVVQHMAALTDGIDVASGRELSVALATGISPRTISFAGPGKSTDELRQAVSAGIIINVESEGELERIATLARELAVTPPVAIRVNPDFELKSSGMKMAGGPKQFGIDAERVPQVLASLRDLPVEFVGFHIFSGSQNLKPESLIEAHDKTFELALQLAAHAPAPLQWLNIGGGFGIPYFPGEDYLDLAPIAANLERLLPDVQQQLPNAEIVMELGRYLVGEAGVYLCEVVDVKESRGQMFAITNGGLHHHLAASGNFGQVIRKNYPVRVANRMDEDDVRDYNVVGPLCTPLDVLADRIPLPEVRVGDLIAVFKSGAYGYTASPRDFLSHPDIDQVLV